MSTDKGKQLKQPGGKKKKKGRKRKPPTGCHICDEDHWTRDCPHIAEVKKLFKSSKTSVVLTDPFPNPGTKLVANQNASRYQVLMLSISKQQNDALISTRNKDYGNPQLSNNKATDQPSSSTTTSTEVVPPIIPELTMKPPKGVVHKSTFNPRAKIAQNYKDRKSVV